MAQSVAPSLADYEVAALLGEPLVELRRRAANDDLLRLAQEEEQRCKGRLLREHDRFRDIATALSGLADVQVTAADAGMLISIKSAKHDHLTIEPVHADPILRAVMFAPRIAPVLIRGETGTGKEFLAKLIHATSRRTGKLVTLNCGSIPASIAEAELFGSVKNGASNLAPRRGAFLEADHGTLFLDEVGELSLDVQAKILRAIQYGTVRHVGGGVDISVDTRIVGATHRDLSQLVAEGRFREDLLHRLDGGRVRLPPLRERRAEILSLARIFLSKLFVGQSVRISVAAGRALKGYDWPGNIRQLGNEVERAAMAAYKRSGLAASELLIEPCDLDPAIVAIVAHPVSSHRRPGPTPRLLDIEEIRTLRNAGETWDAIARRTGWSRSHLHERLKTAQSR